MLSDNDFENVVIKAIEELPEEFGKRLENVEVIINASPNIHQVKKLYARGERGILLGLYEGIPKTKRGSYGIGGQLPDKITIFRNNILRVSRSVSEVEATIKSTVIHEIGHHFGLSDEEIYKATKNM